MSVTLKKYTAGVGSLYDNFTTFKIFVLIYNIIIYITFYFIRKLRKLCII